MGAPELILCSECTHKEFECVSGQCVSMSQVCDGYHDCFDRSDETDCGKLAIIIQNFQVIERNVSA